jgi:Domain of unknown function (DUF4258)
MQPWPAWWRYDIVISPHVIERMQERGFSEIDLRTMLDDAVGHRPSVMPGRFLIEALRGAERWEIVVEPDELERLLTVVTAYRVE